MSLNSIKTHLNEISFIMDNIDKFNKNIQQDKTNTKQPQTNTEINAHYSDEPYVEISLMDVNNQLSNLH